MKAIYFSHDTNSFYDPKVRIMVGQYGIWSYAMFWIILEMMATQKDYRIRFDGFSQGLFPLVQSKQINHVGDGGLVHFEDDKGNRITDEQLGWYSICLADIEALLEFMINIGLFRLTNEKNYKYLYSESLLERMKHRDDVSLKRMESGRLGGLTRGKQMLSNPDSKCLAVKESKVKESIYKRTSSSTNKFVPPTKEQVAEYCLERKNGIDADAFINHYETNGWVQGKNKPIKDWKACVRTWESRKTQSKPSWEELVEKRKL